MLPGVHSSRAQDRPCLWGMGWDAVAIPLLQVGFAQGHGPAPGHSWTTVSFCIHSNSGKMEKTTRLEERLTGWRLAVGLCLWLHH